MTEKINGAVLVAGGYGVVGKQVCETLSKRHPNLKILVGGRNSEKAVELVNELPNAEPLVFDIEADSDPLAKVTVPVACVLAVVNDRNNALLQACIKRKIPYVDITRWTDRVRSAVFETALSAVESPVVFASSWMAGGPSVLTAGIARNFSEIDSIDIDVLYGLADMAGPNSIEYVDRLASPFPVLQNGEWTEVQGLSEPKEATFFSGTEGSTYRFDAPDQVTLPQITGAKSVSTRITYDDQPTMDLMAQLVTSGVWESLSVPAFDDFRLSLLYNPGEGAAHEVTTTIKGKDASGAEKTCQVFVKDNVSQTHLTALGGVIQVEHTIGLDGSAPRGSGIFFAENHRDPEIAKQTLADNGVEIRVA